jgi:hypothetical protein
MRNSNQRMREELKKTLASEGTQRIVIAVSGLWFLLQFILSPGIWSFFWYLIYWILCIICWPICVQAIIGIIRWIDEGFEKDS